MGGNGSKASRPEPGSEVSTSNGLHVLEIHLPTAGFNMGILLVVAVIGIAVWAALRRRRAHRRLKKANGLLPGAQFAPAGWNSPFLPAASYVAGFRGGPMPPPQLELQPMPSMAPWQHQEAPAQWRTRPLRIADVEELDEVQPARRGQRGGRGREAEAHHLADQEPGGGGAVIPAGV